MFERADYQERNLLNRRRRHGQTRRASGASGFGLDNLFLESYIATMNLQIEVEREEDGRWIVEVPDLPGVMAYGQTNEQAIARVKALALRVIADRVENGELICSK